MTSILTLSSHLLIKGSVETSYWSELQNVGGGSSRWRLHSELRFAVAMSRGQFGNPGRRTSAVGTRYQKNGVGQHTERTQFMYSELQTDCNFELAIAPL
jgi:hypothetical protein